MTTMKIRGLLLAGVLALAGCDEGPSVVAGSAKGSVVESTLRYIHARGGVLTEVYGDPFGRSEGDLATKVIAAAQGSIQSPLLRFTGDPKDAGVGNAKFRIAFGYPSGTQNQEMCAKDVPDMEPRQDDKITVLGVFCLGHELLAEAEGWVKNVEGANDLRFRRLISELVISVLENREDS